MIWFFFPLSIRFPLLHTSFFTLLLLLLSFCKIKYQHTKIRRHCSGVCTNKWTSAFSLFKDWIELKLWIKWNRWYDRADTSWLHHHRIWCERNSQEMRAVMWVETPRYQSCSELNNVFFKINSDSRDVGQNGLRNEKTDIYVQRNHFGFFLLPFSHKYVFFLAVKIMCQAICR